MVIEPHDSPAGKAKLFWLGAVVLLLCAASTRFIGLGALDLWEDEVYTYIGSTDLIHKLLAWDGRRANIHSPMLYLEVKVARAVLGNSPGAIRTPAAIYGTAAVLILYLLLNYLVGQGPAFWSALILALNPYAIEWGREARTYSHWPVITCLVIAVCFVAMRQAKREDGSPLYWAWWLMGLLWMALHAYIIFGITTIAAVGLWLGLMGLVELPRHRRAGWVMILGAGVSTGVYLSSWALTGIGRILSRLSRPSSGGGHDLWSSLADAVINAAGEIAGYVPTPVSGLLWLLALVGLILLGKAGHWRLALLVVLIGVMAWGIYPSIAKRHFFAARYVTIALVPLCIGLGCLMHWLCSREHTHFKWLGRGAAAAAVVSLATLWWPAYGQIWCVPKVEFSKAFAPIIQHGQAHEVVTFVPEWYAELDEYYRFTKTVKPVLAPSQALLYTQVDPHGKDLPPGYELDFEHVLGTRRDPSRPIPPATWVFMVEPTQPRPDGQSPLALLSSLAEAYGLDSQAIPTHLLDTAQDAQTLTFRVSPTGIDHVVTTVGRQQQ